MKVISLLLVASMATKPVLGQLPMLTTRYFAQCEGSCHNDDDCAGDLKCFQRNGTESVPGCQGSGESGYDYCFDATLTTPHPSAAPSSMPSSSPSASPTTAPSQSYAPSSGSPSVSPSHSPSVSPSAAPTGTIVVDGTKPLQYIADNGFNASLIGSLEECWGDCDGDDDCDWGLNCFQRYSNENVPGCSGSAPPAKDFCYKPTNPNELVLMGDNGNGISSGLQACQGDCDGDDDCDGNLVCFQRSSHYGNADHAVPGCISEGVPGEDYCFVPTQPTLSYIGNNAFAQGHLKLCEGDCDSDLDCDWGLVCYQRSGKAPVRGCDGSGSSGTDYCVPPGPNELVLMGDEDQGTSSGLLQCQGDCDSDSDCQGALKCFQRSNSAGTANDPVPGCSGSGVPGEDYCYEDSFSTDSGPSQFPATIDPNGPVTYKPGELNVTENDILLSTGLTSRILATEGSKVWYTTGGQSNESFHSLPDGAAVFAEPSTGPNAGGWIYVSNSEEGNGNGGVGAIKFNAAGEVIEYKPILTGTSRNCGGGKTFWNTWLTCEETSNGKVWEVDPWGNFYHETIVGLGDEYESAAYDNRDPNNPIIFVTTDDTNGPLVKFTPDPAAVQAAVNSGDYTNLLKPSSNTNHKHEYLVITDFDNGIFDWTTDINLGKQSAGQYFKNGEGIDIRNGKLYMTAKVDKLLFILDLDAKTFEVSSTQSGAFDSQPDQVARLIGQDDILYFCEDGGSDCGVHGRNAAGQFFTVLQANTVEMYGETTGLAFSPNQMSMYVSFQKPGKIMEVRRTDGRPFGGQRLDIKYHAP